MDVLVSKVVLTHRRRCETSLRKLIHAVSKYIRRSCSTSFYLLNGDDFLGVEF